LAISRQRKEELVAQYTDYLKKSRGIILFDYRGMNVNAMDEVREALRSIGGRPQVVRNRLLELALNEAELSVPDAWLTGPTAIGFCFDEVPPVAKALTDLAKGHEALQIKGGLLERSVLAAEDVQAIADLPPREVLLAQVLGTINAPASRLAGVVNGAIRQVLNVVQAYVDKLEEGPTPPGSVQAAEPA
jgi:large subunit ribosomal protein L10